MTSKFLKIITIIALCTSCGANTQNSNLILASIKYEPPPPPPSSGEPGGRAQGGAGRGCEPTALVPETKSKDGNFLWGLTVAERPQFWFALPRNLTKQDAVEFALKDDQGKQIYKTTLKSQMQGIISFAIPKTVPPLQIGKSYDWSLEISCDYQTVVDRPGTVEGSIQRVAMSTQLKNQLAGANTPVEQANIYAQNGIWFDALTILATNQKDKNSSTALSELLRQVNLRL